MVYSESLALRIRHQLKPVKAITEKRMFGGVGFLLHGNMLVGVWQNSMIVRLGPEQAEQFRSEAFVGEFDVTGRPMTGWLLVDAEGVESDDQVKKWIERAIHFVRTLPRK